MTTYSADSIDAAVALAERFRKEGRYDFFRGQRENWPVAPTLARLKEQEVEAATDRLQLFFSWVQEQPELAALANRDDQSIVDQKYAIAQHYGFPTLFCDFTLDPKVAGFFARTQATAGKGGTSVIVCCREDQLIASCERRFPPGLPLPEVLRISVPNLWRLDAQAGVFLFLAARDFEFWYQFDRIVFPAGSYSGVAPEDIYPTRRSRLEVLLDQYFHFEVDVARHEAAVAVPGIHALHQPQADAMMRECLLDGDPGPHESWLAASDEWKAYRTETWRGSRETRQLHICDDLHGAPTAVGKEVRDRVLVFLNEEPAARWAATSLSSGTPELVGFMERAQMLWDGVRMFPYSDEEIATALANLTVLGLSLLHAGKPTGRNRPSEQAARALWDEPVQVEFGRKNAPAATAYANESALMASLRPDFLVLVRPEYRELAHRAVDAINMVQRPSRAFEFQSFATVFVTQVVPSQLILFKSKAHYFSPLQLEVFGNP